MSMTIRNPRGLPTRRALGTAIALALAGLAAPAHAIQFEFGDGWTGNLDTTVSYGVSMRMQDADRDLIGKSNINPTVFTLSNAAQRGATLYLLICFSRCSSSVLQSMHNVAVGRASRRFKPISTPHESQ